MRAILDTNVLISGLLSKAGAPGKIVDAIVAGRITAVFGPETLAEVDGTVGFAAVEPPPVRETEKRPAGRFFVAAVSYRATR